MPLHPARCLVPLVALALSGCGLLGGAADRDGPASLTIANHSDLAICHVYLPESGALGPAPDRLADERIGPGQIHTFGLPRGRFDVRLDDCQGFPLYARRGVVVRSHQRLDFRVVEVERRRYFGSRRFAVAPSRSVRW